MHTHVFECFSVTEDGRKVRTEPSRSIAEYTRRCLKDYQKRIFNKKTLHKRLPILSWLPSYKGEDAICDLVAGISVGLTVIPQALAYAGIAGLPVAVSTSSSYHPQLILTNFIFP